MIWNTKNPPMQDPFSIHASMAGLVKELRVVAQIDGELSHGPISFREFCEVNSDMGEELKLIADALARNGVYQGGGGGAPIFTVRIALESALEIFNGAFDYCFVMPIDGVDVEGAIELAKLRGRDDIARQLISGLAAMPMSDRVIVRAPGMRLEKAEIRGKRESGNGGGGVKSSIRISNKGNTIRATGAMANILFKALTEPYEPKGIKFYSATRKQEMMLCTDESHHTNGWILYKHPDGQWVTLRKATEADKAELANAISKAHHEA